MVELFGFLQTETLGRRPNHPSDGFSGLRPLARSLPLNKAKKEKRHTLPTMG